MKKSLSQLRSMFEQQIGENQSNFYFVLQRGDWETLQRYSADDLNKLLEDIRDYEYIGDRITIPYFKSREKQRGTKTSR